MGNTLSCIYTAMVSGEKIILWFTSTAFMCCFMFTLTVILMLGIGLGYNYCFVDSSKIPAPTVYFYQKDPLRTFAGDRESDLPYVNSIVKLTPKPLRKFMIQSIKTTWSPSRIAIFNKKVSNVYKSNIESKQLKSSPMTLSPGTLLITRTREKPVPTKTKHKYVLITSPYITSTKPHSSTSSSTKKIYEHDSLPESVIKLNQDLLNKTFGDLHELNRWPNYRLVTFPSHSELIVTRISETSILNTKETYQTSLPTASLPISNQDMINKTLNDLDNLGLRSRWSNFMKGTLHDTLVTENTELTKEQRKPMTTQQKFLTRTTAIFKDTTKNHQNISSATNVKKVNQDVRNKTFDYNMDLRSRWSNIMQLTLPPNNYILITRSSELPKLSRPTTTHRKYTQMIKSSATSNHTTEVFKNVLSSESTMIRNDDVSNKNQDLFKSWLQARWFNNKRITFPPKKDVFLTRTTFIEQNNYTKTYEKTLSPQIKTHQDLYDKNRDDLYKLDLRSRWYNTMQMTLPPHKELLLTRTIDYFNGTFNQSSTTKTYEITLSPQITVKKYQDNHDKNIDDLYNLGLRSRWSNAIKITLPPHQDVLLTRATDFSNKTTIEQISYEKSHVTSSSQITSKEYQNIYGKNLDELYNLGLRSRWSNAIKNTPSPQNKTSIEENNYKKLHDNTFSPQIIAKQNQEIHDKNFDDLYQLGLRSRWLNNMQLTLPPHNYILITKTSELPKLNRPTTTHQKNSQGIKNTTLNDTIEVRKNISSSKIGMIPDQIARNKSLDDLYKLDLRSRWSNSMQLTLPPHEELLLTRTTNYFNSTPIEQNNTTETHEITLSHEIIVKKNENIHDKNLDDLYRLGLRSRWSNTSQITLPTHNYALVTSNHSSETHENLSSIRIISNHNQDDHDRNFDDLYKLGLRSRWSNMTKVKLQPHNYILVTRTTELPFKTSNKRRSTLTTRKKYATTRILKSPNGIFRNRPTSLHQNVTPKTSIKFLTTSNKRRNTIKLRTKYSTLTRTTYYNNKLSRELNNTAETTETAEAEVILINKTDVDKLVDAGSMWQYLKEVRNTESTTNKSLFEISGNLPSSTNPPESKANKNHGIYHNETDSENRVNTTERNNTIEIKIDSPIINTELDKQQLAPNVIIPLSGLDLIRLISKLKIGNKNYTLRVLNT